MPADSLRFVANPPKPATPAAPPKPGIKKTLSLARTPYQRQVWIRALLESGMSLNAVAKASGMSVPIVIAIKRMVPSNLADIEKCKKTVIGSFYGLARASQENITPDKLEASSAYQLMGMASLAVQAARDMEGLNRPQFNVVEIALNLQRLTEQSKTRLAAITSSLDAQVVQGDLK